MSEASPEDVQEQRSSLTGDAALTPVPELPDDVPVADALDQARAVAPDEHVAARSLPSEADEADAAEQAVVVEHDEEAHRD